MSKINCERCRVSNDLYPVSPPHPPKEKKPHDCTAHLDCRIVFILMLAQRLYLIVLKQWENTVICDLKRRLGLPYKLMIFNEPEYTGCTSLCQLWQHTVCGSCIKKIKISMVLCLSRAIISLRVICHDEFFLSYHILSLAKFGIFCHWNLLI